MKKEYKKKWIKSILFRTAFFSWILIIVSILAFILTMLPSFDKIATERMKNEAKDIASSIGQVTATAIITEDYSFAVEHCMKIVQESHSILYVVITKKDGFSLIHTSKDWKQENLSGFWVPKENDIKGKAIRSDLINKEVFHYSYPFSYSGINWGWIHIGLSLDSYNRDIREISLMTLLLAAICILLGLAASIYFARKLIKPIRNLDEVTQSVAEGDLSVRLSINTGDELESLAGSFNKMTENLQKSQLELISQKDYIDNIVRSINDILIVTDKKGTIKTINEATIKFLDYSESELIGNSICNILSEKDKNRFNDLSITEMINNHSIFNIEMEYISKHNVAIPVLFTAATLKSDTGEIEDIVTVAHDITDRKKAEEMLKKSHNELEMRVKERTKELAEINVTLQNEIIERKKAEEIILTSLKEKEVMLKEIHHRVKNNLQIISSLLNLQSSYIIDKKDLELFKESQYRVKSMAMIHEKLYQSKDLGHIDIKDYLKNLTDSLSRSYGTNGRVKLNLDVESISFSIDTAVPCGLIINELVSNSLKYAFPKNNQGTINISIKENGDNKKYMIVSDNGIGLPKDFKIEESSSLGLKLVNILTKQLNGKINFYNNNGTKYEIIF